MLKSHARFLGRHDRWKIAIGRFGIGPSLPEMRERLRLSWGGPFGPGMQNVASGQVQASEAELKAILIGGKDAAGI